jgi:hypothetical protein
MSDLVERYVHQVGRYLPPKERADIEAELRSQIHDQLEDRFDGAPTQADVADVLAELGDPRRLAASYNREQYLVGPDLYPYLVRVLRYVWVVVPSLVIFFNIFGALASSRQATWGQLLVETLSAVVQATLIFSAVAVLIFALIQRIIAELEKEFEEFDPVKLPQVNDPHAVDRLEGIVGIVIGAFVTLILLYCLRVGGLPAASGVIPVPMGWLLLLIGAIIAMVVLHLWMLRRNRWTVPLWITETILELLGMICLYFVVYEPLAALSTSPLIQSLPEILVIFTALVTLLSKGSKLVGMFAQ